MTYVADLMHAFVEHGDPVERLRRHEHEGIVSPSMLHAFSSA